MIFQLAPYRWDKEMIGNDNDSDLDGDGGALHPLRPGRRTGPGGGRRRRRGRGGGGGAGPVHRGDAVSVDGGDGGHAAVGAGRPAVPAAGPSSAPALPPGGGRPAHYGRHLRQCVRQSAGPGQRRHPPGSGSRPGTGPEQSRHGLRRTVHAGGMQHRLPTTVASVRAAQGCQTPFDILPAVWLASALSVGVGILACKAFSKVWRA